MESLRHSIEVVQIHEEILQESPAEGRFIEIGNGRKIHVIEAGEGPPLVFLHGTGAAAYMTLPLLERLEGVRAIAPDLPGHGLSDPANGDQESFRERAVGVVDQILDALDLDQISLAGNSAGGVWAIWYALAYPQRVERLILLGAPPLLPGTHAPFPQRMMATPIIGDLIARIPVNEDTAVQIMEMLGEGETIVNYPKMVEALAASNNDPVASETNRRELSAFANLFGFRSEMKIEPDELRQLKMPILLIWGKRDPLGGADVARSVRETIPGDKLTLLPAGHMPWLGHPEKTAELMLDFVRTG